MVEMDFNTLRDALDAERSLPQVSEKFNAKRMISRKRKF
jgi:hypothetical protein